MADSHTADLAALEAELAGLERQLAEPARLEQARAVVLGNLEREERELELAANNTARRFEELGRAEQAEARAAKPRNMIRLFGQTAPKRSEPNALETAVTHHRAAADIARRREEAQREKVRALSKQLIDIERQVDDVRKRDEPAIRYRRDVMRADLAERTDADLTHRLRENELSLMAKRREREDWIAELDFER